MNSRQEAGPEGKLLRPQEVQRELGISRRTYQRHLADGTLTASRRTLRGHRRFTQADIAAARSRAAVRCSA